MLGLLRHLFPTLVCALFAGLGVASCGPAGPPEEPTELEAREAEGGERPAPQPIDPATVGSIAGRVRWPGPAPEREVIRIGKACPGHPTTLLSDRLIVEEGGVTDVLVHVRRGLAGWEIPPAEPQTATVDQVGCRYTPHVVALRAGGTLRVTNGDELAHNVRLSARRNSVSRNVTQSRGAEPLEVVFPRPEQGIAVVCDLHPWMGARVHVLDHPFYDLTGAGGAFALGGLPPGEYEIEARHETLGRIRETVMVEAGAETALDLEFEAR